MKHILPLVLVPVLFAASLGVAAQESAEEGSGEIQGIYFERTDVNVTNVEVFVTDKKGNRVKGLTREDFEIRENGEPMEITNFYAVADGVPVAGGVPLETLAEQDLGRPGLKKIAVPDDQRLHLVLYVDNFNLRPADRNRVLPRMERFLRTEVDRDDRVMVTSYDRSLHVRQTFTSDMNLVLDALQELEKMSGIAVLRDAERRTAYEEVEEAQDVFTAMSQARGFADSVYLEMDFTLDALSNHVSSLSGLVGRKAILYVSDGLPLRAGEDLFLHVDNRFRSNDGRMESYNYDLSSRFRELVAKANASSITFYTLDAGGLTAHESLSAEFGGTAQGGGRAFIDNVRRANLQAPLHLMADDTGGQAITNTNAVEKMLGRVAADFDDFYSLGYQPPHQGDGRYYKIEVKVRGKGLRVRHRNGYRDKSAEARLTDGAIAALYFGYETNPLGAGLEFGATSRDDNHYLLPLTVKIPLGQLTLAPSQDVYVGRVKVSVVVMDEDGRVSPVKQQEPLTLSIPAAEIDAARQQHVSYDITLQVRRGVVRVVVGVRDELSAELSFLRETLKIDS